MLVSLIRGCILLLIVHIAQVIGHDCLPGTYGPDCSKWCAQGCAGICDPESGKCTCKPNYEGKMCTECKRKYGPTCNLPCSVGCVRNCNRGTAECDCKPGFNGSKCTECLGNWFGPDCKFKCKCRAPSTCNNQGVCSKNGLCEEHSFGPGCQYVDILSWEFAESVPLYIRDSNDGTCNPDPTATSIEVSLVRATPFTWYRLVVNDNTNVRDFFTTFNEGDTCWNEKHYRLDNVIIDVTCDTPVLVNTLRVKGPIAPGICTLNINAGRPLATRQETWQSSNFENNLDKCQSSNAVDGNSDGDYNSGHCSQTAREAKGPEWGVRFSQPAIVHLININNRDDYYHRLVGLHVGLYDRNMNLITYFIANGSNPYYKFYVATFIPISEIRIKQSTTLELSDRILALCEVRVYGDPECPDNRYGIYCEQKCTCKKTDACSFVTGACAPGCPPGFYGFNCSRRCSAHCAYETCNYFSGNCAKCINDFMGDKCDTECLPGTYGHKLPCFNCSVGCVEACNTSTGYCSCKPPYIGPRCAECRPGTYGPEWSCHICSFGCADICNKTTGHCTCKEGFTGLQCSGCRSGTFGESCEFTCSDGCNNTCDSKDGRCDCLHNYQGHFCGDCVSGTFGSHCQLQCSDGCNSTCRNTDGHCNCKKGFQGQRCSECATGFYGETCRLKCGRGCDGKCYRTNARCLCKSNYQGLFCVDCKPGYYGSDCEMECSLGCQTICDPTNGTCSPCNKYYFLGPQCAVCESPRYGRRCDLSCSMNCLNRTCNRWSGRCAGCIPGFEGERCFDAVAQNYGWLVILAFLILLTLLACCGYICSRNKPVVIKEEAIVVRG